MQQMRRGMIECNRLATFLIHVRTDRITNAQFALFEHTHMGKRSANFLGIADHKAPSGARQEAAIADLSAALRIERGVVQHDLAFLPGPQNIDQCAVEYQRRDLR